MMNLLNTLIENFEYFTVSFYLMCAIITVTVPVLVVRLLRTFPYYVKHGDLGKNDNCFWLSNTGRTTRTQIRDFFRETHPAAIGGDLLSITLFTAVLYMAWGLVPFIVTGRLIWLGVATLANHMRDQHLKKEEFHAALKGD